MGTRLETIQDVMAEQLSDLRSAEQQLVEALPKMADAASSDELRQAFRQHLEQTREHERRVQGIIDQVDFEVPGEECKAMKGLIAEGEEIIDADGSGEAKDQALIAAAQRVEHYEMAAYGTARALAEHLELSSASDALSQTLEEESSTNETLTDIATNAR